MAKRSVIHTLQDNMASEIKKKKLGNVIVKEYLIEHGVNLQRYSSSAKGQQSQDGG